MKKEGSDEEILMELRPARRRFTKEYIGAILWAVIGLILFYVNWDFSLGNQMLKVDLLGSAFFLSSALIFFIYAEARRFVEQYIITDTAVYEKVGLFSNRTTDIPFMKLQRCGINKPFLEKIVGVGDVRVDAGHNFFIIKGIANAEEVNNLIENRMREVMSGGNVAAVHDN